MTYLHSHLTTLNAGAPIILLARFYHVAASFAEPTDEPVALQVRGHELELVSSDAIGAAGDDGHG
jgi:hypothetical protein